MFRVGGRDKDILDILVFLKWRRGGALRYSTHYTHEFGVSVRLSNKWVCKVLGNVLTPSHTHRQANVCILWTVFENQKGAS